MMFRLRAFGSLFVFALTYCVGLPGTQIALSVEPAEAKTPAVEAEAKIDAALLSPTSLEFVETPLQDVIDFLKDQHQIEIQLDTKALEAASIGNDTPVSRSLKGLSLSAALKQLLSHLELTYVVQDEVLLITSQAAAHEMVDVRAYDVSNLTSAEEAIALAGVLRSALVAGPRASGQPIYNAPAAGAHAAGGAYAAAGTLGGGGGGSAGSNYPAKEINIESIDPFRNTLIVRASYHGHKAVDKLLSDLGGKLGKGQAAPPAKLPAPAAVPALR